MTKKIIFTILFVLLFKNCFSQNFKKIFCEIDYKDKIWIISNPISSLKVKKISKEVNYLLNKKLKEKYLDSDGAGGKVDAFRHIFLLYKLSSEIGIEKARKFGNIYESYNKKIFFKITNSGYDQTGETMDKFNNELGIYLFMKLDKIEDKKLIQEIENQIKNGNALKIKKDQKGRSLNLEGEKIEDSIWMKQWNNQRVLIQSNK